MPLAIQRPAIQTAIYNKLISVTGVANVSTGPKTSREAADFLANAVTSAGVIQQWTIRRVASVPETSQSAPGDVPTMQVSWKHTFLIDFYYAYQADVSEDAFQSIIDAVLLAFQSQRTLGGFSNERPLALTGIEEYSLQGVIGYIAHFELTQWDFQIPVAFE